jgi:hypothetical protein
MRILWILAPIMMVATIGCGTAGTPVQQQDATLASRLLTQADLPGGFRGYSPDSTDRPTSDRPDCENTLQSLEIDGPPPGATEARTTFMADDGTSIQHVVRQYSDDGANTTLRDASRVLANCRKFELRYADGTTMTSSVETLTSTDDRWTGNVIVDADALSLHNRLTLLSAGNRLAVLSIVTPDQVDEDLVATLTDVAQAKLN